MREARRRWLRRGRSLNFGLSEGWEAVFEGRGETPLSPSGSPNLTEAGAFLKHVVVPGEPSGQEADRASRPNSVCCCRTVPAIGGVGVSLAGIVSQRWDWGTVHFNVEDCADARPSTRMSSWAASSKAHRNGRWRPVAEVFLPEGIRRGGKPFLGWSVLIWQVSDKAPPSTSPFGTRLTNGHPLNEVRAGLTFAVPLRLEGAHKR